MILLTVGTQLPFDRFVRIVDRLAPQLDEPVFAQIGHGRYRPENMAWQAFIGPIEFERLIGECSYIVSHAGIGTMVMAQKHRKPMILFPRRAELEEHRNDHQLATVRALDGRPGIRIAYDEAGLASLIADPQPDPPAVDRLPERDRLRHAIADLLVAEQHRRIGS
ncbi:glycosyltransferase [Sphingomonas jatrophae]|uniref:Glycosyltransferase family 28 C-terminal domain-containing protein n=1 Tax=Sphingomonas jatrophae TaxID=1166337 RepID=A0A1I6M5T4_9SPHN|nr:glycosyltransferase [Sphingomonas jatrophae]SFS10978.1 Glycosyltransferase family 28 C-terminal domain-containing protein [Sphingomonas jatrophae]